MKNKTRFKFLVGRRVYYSNSPTQTQFWLKSCAKKKWKAYIWDFEKENMLWTMGGKIYWRRFGDRKWNILRDTKGIIKKY